MQPRNIRVICHKTKSPLLQCAQLGDSENRMGKNTFNFDRRFLSRLVELCHDEQVSSFELAKEEPIPKLHEKPHRPFARKRIERHIRELIEVSFWASLRKEEGHHPRFTLMYKPPSIYNAGRDLYTFEKPIPFDVRALVKLAPAVQTTSNIGVWPDEEDKLTVWGFAPPLRGLSLYIKTIDPGQLTLSLADFFKAAVTDQRAEFVDEFKFKLLPELFGKARSAYSPQEPQHNWLVEQTRNDDISKIAVAMRAHGHGGTLLIVPNETVAWRASIEMDLFRFSGAPYARVNRDLKERDKAVEQFFNASDLHRSLDNAQQSLEFIGQLTAIDGATLVTYDFTVLGFGAKIKLSAKEKQDSSDQPAKPDCIIVSGPFEKDDPKPKSLSEMFWGNRHKSAIQFVFDQRDAIAIVASVDGTLSVILWDAVYEMVSVIQDAEFLLL
jgi:hypothetical protein